MAAKPFSGVRGKTPLPRLFKYPLPPLSVARITDVVYEDGFIHLITDGQDHIIPYTPALLIHPRVYPLVADDVEGRVAHHPHAVEVRADLDTLVDICRRVSRISSAFLFLPPERQFLLDKHTSLHAEIKGGSPSLSPPSFRSKEEALAYVLRARGGYPPRIFVENVFFTARIAVSLARVRSVYLPPDALREVLSANLSPDSLGGEHLLPSSIVRVLSGDPVLFPSFWSDVDAGYGRGVLEYGEGKLGILADAEYLNLPYRIVKPITVSSSPGALPRAILSLLSFSRASALLSTPRGNIVEIALRTSSPRALSSWYLFEAVAEILSPLPSFLASTGALTPAGRASLIVLHRLRQRAPELYKRLSPHIPVCSRGLSALESFLRGLSSLRLEPLRSSTYRRE